METNAPDPDGIRSGDLPGDGDWGLRVAWYPFGRGSYLRVTGSDGPSFVHAMCTNDVKSLSPGAGCEAFATDVQGRTVGHLFILAGDDGLRILAPGGQAASLRARWERFVIRERVTIEEADEERVWAYCVGPESTDWVRRWGAELADGPRLAHGRVGNGPGAWIWCRWATDLPAWVLGWRPDEASEWEARLSEAGIHPCDASEWESLRIARGWPMFGQDITSENFPQEVDRDAAAISFKKGCYLGQETVARIDALGRVNRILRGLRLSDGVRCAPGDTWYHEGKIIAHITSVANSARHGGRIALAYVRRAWEAPGSRLPLPAGQWAEVVGLPK